MKNEIPYFLEELKTVQRFRQFATLFNRVTFQPLSSRDMPRAHATQFDFVARVSNTIQLCDKKIV